MKDHRNKLVVLALAVAMAGAALSPTWAAEGKGKGKADRIPTPTNPEAQQDQKLNDRGGADLLPEWPAVVIGKASGPQGDTLESIAMLPDWSKRWQPRGPFRYGSRGTNQLPLKPVFMKKQQDARDASARGEEVKSTTSQCIPNGMPMIMTSTQGSLEWLMTPGRVTMISDDGELRRIWTDGRKENPDPDPTFQGHSVGHWENGALVVSTNGLDTRNQLWYGFVGAGTGKMRVLEKGRLTDKDVITFDMTIEDPDTFIHPVTFKTNYFRTQADSVESLCIQNNRDVDTNTGTVGFSLEPPANLGWKPPGSN